MRNVYSVLSSFYSVVSLVFSKNKLRLKQEDGTYFEHSSELVPPVVQPAFILIFPGEELFIEAAEGKDASQHFRHIP
ncbi:MAG: hypothetical protein D3906_11955, partial [Candidatus Electrothrix sp. AUS1_2]|nr:hypothetical protein [Candidatus Electrothrix sp. AUS1_2]